MQAKKAKPPSGGFTGGREVVRMEKKQTTIRLTIRAPGEMADWVKEEARREGKSMNQYILKILNLWRKSRH